MSRRNRGARPVVRIVGPQTGGVIRGVTSPGAEIDVVNLSASAADPTGFHDAVTIARADERGRFAGRFPMRAQDVIRVRARPSDGAVGPWRTFRARGLGGSPRPPKVALSRIGVAVTGSGSLRVFNLSAHRSIAAPGSVLIVENPRVGERARVVVNDRGKLARSITLAGRGGDVLHVEHAARPGRVLGTLVAPETPLRRRAPAERVATCAHYHRLRFSPALKTFRKPLFARRPRASDVFQSDLGNCHLASASAALAHVRPDFVERLIVPLARGTYRVRFRTFAAKTGVPITHHVEVSPDLYVRPSGDLLYGATSPGARTSMWWPILEKAYARWKGGYRKLEAGGCADNVLQTLLGRRARRFFVDADKPGEHERVWNELARAFATRRPVCAGTSSFSPRKYRNTGLIPNHAYSVLACRESRGRRTVDVRNPWGEDAAAPCRPRRDGVLELDLDEFVRLFCVISTVR